MTAYFRIFILSLLSLAYSGLRADEVPEDLSKALETFRSEGAWGYAFTQHTWTAKRSMEEKFTPLGPVGDRWTLVSVNGAAPSSKETSDYIARRSAMGETAPNVKDQIIRDTCTAVFDFGTVAAWRFLIQRGDTNDKAAAHMAVVFYLHRPSGTITQVELASFEPFKPVFGVSVKEASTVIRYSVPHDDVPSLLESVHMRVRGKAFLVRSLDDDMEVTFSDYHFAGKKASDDGGSATKTAAAASSLESASVSP